MRSPFRRLTLPTPRRRNAGLVATWPGGDSTSVIDPTPNPPLPYRLPLPLPDEPFRIPESTPSPVRAAILNEMIGEGMKDPAVRAWADELLTQWSRSARKGRSVRDLAAFGLQVVQNTMTYTAQKRIGDWFQKAGLTLRIKRGNCEALSVLLGVLYGLWGILSEIVWIRQPSEPLDHVSLIAWLNRQPEWAESTIRGARLGEGPYDAAKRTGIEESLHNRGVRP